VIDDESPLVDEFPPNECATTANVYDVPLTKVVNVHDGPATLTQPEADGVETTV
jgi:hypothetical protein